MLGKFQPFGSLAGGFFRVYNNRLVLVTLRITGPNGSVNSGFELFLGLYKSSKHALEVRLVPLLCYIGLRIGTDGYWNMKIG